MTAREFHQKARALLKAQGAIDIDIHDGTDAVSVSCRDGFDNTYVWHQPFGCRPESDVFDEAFRNIEQMASSIAVLREDVT